MDFAMFGCALDALDAPEKVAMKLAFMEAVLRGRVRGDVARDPYDLLRPLLAVLPGIVDAGRLELEPWLTPRPRGEKVERVDAARYREFLDSGGCERVSGRLKEFVLGRVLPLRPLLLGVDHSLSGGVFEALAGGRGRDIALVVLDSHFDAVPAAVRAAAAEDAGMEGISAGLGELPDSYNCGTWIAGLLDARWVRPEDVIVIGTSDHPGPEAGPVEGEGLARYRDSYLSFERRGVTVVPKRSLRERGVAVVVREALSAIGGKPVYLSIDADIGAGEMKAVRFLDTIGLSAGELASLSGELARGLEESGSTLAGLDVMEVDVHLADIPGSQDDTLELCSSMVAEIIGAGGESIGE